MDSVLETMGWFGPYQRKQFILLMLPGIDFAFSVMSFMFIGKNFDHQCSKTDSNYSGGFWDDGFYPDVLNDSALNVTYGSCRVTVTNQSEVVFKEDCPYGYLYSEPRENSFVSEWDLVCDKDGLGEFTQTVMSLGMLLGAFVFSTPSDWYGRKPVYVTTHIMFLVISVAMAFAPNYVTFLCLRFLYGATQQGLGLSSCMILLELIPTERRAFSSQVGGFLWPCTLLLLGIVCYLCQEFTWRNLQLVLGLFSSYALLEVCLVDESLRWLTANNKTEEAERILKKAARSNGVDVQVVLELYRKDSQRLLGVTDRQSDKGEIILESVGDEEKTSSALTDAESKTKPLTRTNPEKVGQGSVDTEGISVFVKNRQVFVLTAITCFIWFTDSLAYYGLMMTSSTFHENLYLEFSLNVAVEFPAAVAMALLINRVGRKPCCVGAHLLCGVSLLVGVFLSNTPSVAGMPGLKMAILVVNLLGKFGISLGFGVVWLYSSELYPTNIRSTAFGISSVAARIGGMIAPFSRTLGRHYSWLPGLTFAVLCLCIPVLTWFLPETRGHELPQTVSDMLFTGMKPKPKEEKRKRNEETIT